jgi:site-specific DNA-methyltransferase (adenine-specific)
MLESGFFNMDCMDGMREFPDKFFQLCICDPPYGIGISSNPVRQAHAKKRWDDNIPNKEYFDELFRVSQNQIIWGGNYFALPATQNLIVWDKLQPHDFSLAMCEFAWCSIQRPAKMFRYSVLTERDKIHATQKPIALYTWLLQNYAKRGDKILDTHVGSASSLIACHRMGFEYWGFELDADYYKAASERLAKEQATVPLFEPQEIYKQEGLTFDT